MKDFPIFDKEKTPIILVSVLVGAPIMSILTGLSQGFELAKSLAISYEVIVTGLAFFIYLDVWFYTVKYMIHEGQIVKPKYTKFEAVLKLVVYAAISLGTAYFLDLIVRMYNLSIDTMFVITFLVASLIWGFIVILANNGVKWKV